MTIQPIVEGHGEVDALPVLLRRIAAARGESELTVMRPIRIHRSRLAHVGELERATELAARLAGPEGRILIVVDANGDCPAMLGPEWQRRASLVRPNLHVGVVLAKSEFESWFLASFPSLRGYRGVSTSAEVPDDPEAIRGAKEHLRRYMEAGHHYSETIDQVALAARMDLDLATRNSRSFRKLLREFARLMSCGFPD